MKIVHELFVHYVKGDWEVIIMLFIIKCIKTGFTIMD